MGFSAFAPRAIRVVLSYSCKLEAKGGGMRTAQRLIFTSAISPTLVNTQVRV